MFNFNYFSSLHSKGFKTLGRIGHFGVDIKAIKFDVIKGKEHLLVLDKQNKKYKFDLTKLQWFNDNGVVLVLESVPLMVNGQPKCDRWYLSRQPAPVLV